MLLVPQKGIVRVEHNAGTVGSATFGTAVTTSGTASVKGTVAELITSTAFDSYWIDIIAHSYAGAAADNRGCLDIMVGAATESIIIPDLLMGGAKYPNLVQQGFKTWSFPLYIPAGSRISAKAAGARLSLSVRVAVYLRGGNGAPPWRVGSKVTTYGIGTVPDGTSITPGASGAEGAWTQIVASTTEDHFAFVPSFQLGNDLTTNLRNFAVDLGIGAATEEMIAEGYHFMTDDSECTMGPYPTFPTFADVPSGTRLVMRASNNGVNDGAYSGAIHAVS